MDSVPRLRNAPPTPADSTTSWPSPPPLPPTAGLEGVPTHQYTTLKDLQKHINARSTEVREGRSTQQFVVFNGITEDIYERISSEKAGRVIGKAVRFRYHPHQGTLIIKVMTTPEHELAHRSMSMMLDEQLLLMGVNRRQWGCTGAAEFTGVDGSKKQGDTTYKPIRTRPRRMDWPTLVFECGYSESLPRLKNDARWWLSNSRGDVRIAIVILVSKPPGKRLVVEKWIYAPVNRQTRSGTQSEGMLAQRIDIVPNPAVAATANAPLNLATTAADADAPPAYLVTGGPLTFEFDSLLLRNPDPTLPLTAQRSVAEGDITFTAQDLEEWADDFWASLQ